MAPLEKTDANTTVAYCPLCDQVLWRESPRDDLVDLLAPHITPFNIDEVLMTRLRVAWAHRERVVEAHMESKHARRYRLYKRLGWRWLIGVR